MVSVLGGGSWWFLVVADSVRWWQAVAASGLGDWYWFLVVSSGCWSR